jgi:leucyl-tRNA synthetase
MDGRGVDLYVGGVEHAVLHLLYARFWHKVLYDLGHVSTPEPFGRLFNQGYIQAYCYRDERGVAVPADQVVNADGKPAADVQGQVGETFFYDGEPVTEEYGKMGKSLKNAVAPDDVCDEYGCDTLRLYEMYMGPLDASKPWATRDIVGVHRFLQRVWRNFVNEETGELLVGDDEPTDDQLRLLHRTIERVTTDCQRLSFNTAIAALIEMNNALVGADRLPRAIAEPFVLMIAPMAPHIAEELWQRLGHDGSVSARTWPVCDEQYLVDESIEIVVQILGKVRGKVMVPADADEKAVEAAALADERIAELIAGKTVRKVIVVPGRLVNIVAN